MKVFNILFIILFTSCVVSCNYTANDTLLLKNSNYRIWWLYDETISDGPTPIFLCFNIEKYQAYSLSRFGTLNKALHGDVIYPLTEGGKWAIKHDSLFLQSNSFSTIISKSDTVFLGSRAYLIDATDIFVVKNCDCDSLLAQFKGGTTDRFKDMKAVLNYKK